MKITIVKKDYWFVLWDIKKIILWQDYFCFVDEFGLIHPFGVLEIEKIYADDKKIYEKNIDTSLFYDIIFTETQINHLKGRAKT